MTGTMLPRTVTGTVLHGKQLGRTLGFPTANLLLAEGETAPGYGVYVSLLRCGNAEYPAVTNVGRHPTLPDGPATVETNILPDGSYDLYGREISVTLLDFLRPEQCFRSPEELTEAVQENRRQAIAWFRSNRPEL